tara:strand:- start:230 stop:922 length:693 start_codon:yes stop_codon:yes gene_type:complete
MKTLIFPLLLLFVISNSCRKDNNLENNLELNPTKTQLIFPDNVSECIEGSILSDTQSEVFFRWTSTENTDYYELHITNLVLSNTKTYSTEDTELPITIERGTPYSWYVSSKNNSATTISDLWSFYNSSNQTQYFIPFPAQNISPEIEVVLPSNQKLVTLEWDGNDLDSDILEYDLYFEDLNPPDIYQEKIKENSLGGVPISSGNTYYWKITTRDELGNESDSNIFVFEVE